VSQSICTQFTTPSLTRCTTPSRLRPDRGLRRAKMWECRMASQFISRATAPCVSEAALHDPHDYFNPPTFSLWGAVVPDYQAIQQVTGAALARWCSLNAAAVTGGISLSRHDLSASWHCWHRLQDRGQTPFAPSAPPAPSAIPISRTGRTRVCNSVQNLSSPAKNIRVPSCESVAAQRAVGGGEDRRTKIDIGLYKRPPASVLLTLGESVSVDRRLR
jgi:hypothetical protein